jgi:predicted nucleic acid-binding protein
MEPLSLEGLPDDALLLVDTAPIIYILERHPTFGPYFQPLFDAHAAGNLRFAVTTVTIAEVLTGPFKAQKDDLGRRYRMVLESWRVIPLTVDIAESAARSRAEIGLRLPDAIQLASAVAINAFALVTHDRDFSAVRGFRIVR